MPLCHLHPLPYHADPTVRFALLQGEPGAVLLDSGRPLAERGRYDLMTAWPLQVLQPAAGETGQAFFTRTRAALASLGRADLPAGADLPFAGGLLGYLGYDFGRRLERLPAGARADLALPDARLGLHAWALVSDHQARTSQLVCHPALDAGERQRLIALFDTGAAPRAEGFRLTAPFAADIDQPTYRQRIEAIQAYIAAGDCYQVNFAQRFRAPFQGSPWTAYQALRAACPTPFSGYLALERGALLSHSPERFLRVSRGQVETRPIKGTRPRRADPAADAAEARALLASAKDLDRILLTPVVEPRVGLHFREWFGGAVQQQGFRGTAYARGRDTDGVFDERPHVRSGLVIETVNIDCRGLPCADTDAIAGVAVEPAGDIGFGDFHACPVFKRGHFTGVVGLGVMGRYGDD